jgi:hypothetical protein
MANEVLPNNVLGPDDRLGRLIVMAQTGALLERPAEDGQDSGAIHVAQTGGRVENRAVHDFNTRCLTIDVEIVAVAVDSDESPPWAHSRQPGSAR